MTITLTELAAEEIKRVIAEQKLPPNAALRIAAAGGGCSGYEYRLGLEEEPQVDEGQDTVITQHGLTVVIDNKSAVLLNGTTIDYHNGIDRRGFVFNNPNATKTCGCGSSFQV